MNNVVIMGGGLAGLSLAIQLKNKIKDIDVTVIEREKHPVPLAAHKVGEATVEIGGHYFNTVLGMQEHMKKSQILKPGLRFYFTAGDNTDISKRGEFGHSHWPKVPAYQLDRGVFENGLAEKCVELGVNFHDSAKVKGIEIDKENLHTITFEQGSETTTMQCKWLVDTTGRTALLRKKKGLTLESPHKCGSVWFRVQKEIDIDSWSDSPDWHDRVEPNLRRYATNHLMGKGYWVWVIPLSSGATSVGIVSDPKYHDVKEMRTLETAMEWLRKYEPQCAKEIDENPELVLDFKYLKTFSNDCKEVYAGDNTFITGVAGPFLDPFYSPGSDFISLGNTFVTDLIYRSSIGEDIDGSTALYNYLFMDIFRNSLNVYANQYGIWGNPQVMTCKMTWDFSYYWGVFALLFFNDKFTDQDFLLKIMYRLEKVQELSVNMQKLFREWDEVYNPDRTNFYVDQFDIEYLYEFHSEMDCKFENSVLEEKIIRNISMLESIGINLVSNIVESIYGKNISIDLQAIDPYTITVEQIKNMNVHSKFQNKDKIIRPNGLEKIFV